LRGDCPRCEWREFSENSDFEPKKIRYKLKEKETERIRINFNRKNIGFWGQILNLRKKHKKINAKKWLQRKNKRKNVLEANFMIKQNGYLDMRANLDFEPAPSFA
jgi:hypothetical protein